jgi:hypothetical protein
MQNDFFSKCRECNQSAMKNTRQSPMNKGKWTTYQEWNRKAIEYNRNGYEITVSDLLENEATKKQKDEGIDIADFFMKNLYKSG